jgi:hypothetical protein
MRQLSLALVFAIPLLVAATGCNPDSPFSVLFNPPECSIIDVQKSDPAWPQPAKIVMTVQNRSDATAYNIQCDITLKSGNFIVDDGVIFFGTLGSGEIISEEVLFWKLSSHSEYTSATYHLCWYDSQGTYHD